MATNSINTSGISVGPDGKISFSGISSGIDSKALIDAQVKARRASAVKLETGITKNNTLVKAYGELKTLTSKMTTALDKLRGSTAFTTTDVFKAKTASGTTAALPGAPAGYTPSSINDLMVASIDSKAAVGNHRISIKQLAQAHQLRGDVVTDKTTALGQSGTFTINGKTITMAATDTLLDLRSKINSAGAGVNATVVSGSATENYLVLTSSKTGEDNAIDFGGGNAITDALGLTAGGAVKTELQQAKNAILDVNGITGIERSSNTVSDVIEGVTLNLTKADAFTEITLKIEPDLNAVKTAINDFAVAYNELKTYISDQRTAKDRNDDGVIGADEFGPLAFDSTLRSMSSQLGQMVSTEMASASDGFRSLSQIGLSLNAESKLQIDDSVIDAKLLGGVDNIRKLFVLDYSSSDARLTLQGRSSSTASGTYYVNIAGTDGTGAVTTANISSTAGTGLGGAANGSLSPTGSTLTATGTTPASGLSMYFSAGPNAAATDQIQVTVSRGLADLFYDVFEGASRATTGQLDVQVTQLQQQNTDYTSRIQTIDARIDVFRASLERKYVAMETSLARLEQLRNRIQQYADSLGAK